MDGAGQQLFAGSGLALDEHGGVGGRDGFNLAQHVAQAGAFAHDVFKTVVEIDLVFEILLFLVRRSRNSAICLKASALLTAMATCPATWPSISASCCEKAFSRRLATIMEPRVRLAVDERNPDCRLHAH
jgi:hypothetical protein